MGARTSSCLESFGGRRQLADTESHSKGDQEQKQDVQRTVVDILGIQSMRIPLPFAKEDDVVAAQNFKAQQGDVMIVTYPKCGTTWCQQLCHQLRTGGHTEFEEISEERIVPWLEVSSAVGIDLSLPQVAAPRCFKTHQMLGALSRFEKPGARFLCVLRDPEATLLSEFKFLLSKGAPGTEDKDINTFATQIFFPGARWGGSLWQFYSEFWRCRMLPNVHLVIFEELKRDLEKQVLAIAEFMGLPPPDAALRAKVLELGSFAWMQKNDHLFDDHHMGPRLAEMKGKGKGKGGKASHTASTKVGLQVGDDVNTKLTEETRSLLSKAWREIMEPITGHATYNDMIEELKTA